MARLIREELEAPGWNADDPRRHRKSHASKIRIAARLRWETTMTLDWIAWQLRMNSLSGNHRGGTNFRLVSRTSPPTPPAGFKIIRDKMHPGPRLMSPVEFSLRLSCALLCDPVIASKHGAGEKMPGPEAL